jgi:hypothetical protein
MKEDIHCDNHIRNFASYLLGDLNEEEKLSLDRHLEQCPECRKELEETALVWNLLGKMPDPAPSGSMKEGFMTMMADYKKELVTKSQRRRRIDELFGFLKGSFLPRPAFSVLLLLIGLSAGYLMHQPGRMTAQNRQIDSLSSQISEMKQIMMLSLLQDQSASRRIQAVSYTDDFTSIDKKITDALFTTLNEDTNVNVRLATLEALVKLANDPVVREGLIRSIELQDSPIMQSAIADVMVKLHEKKSVEELRRLLERKDINQMVKVNIENSIQQLI